MNNILYVVIGGRHEVGVIGVYDDEAKANEAVAVLQNGAGGYVEFCVLNDPTDFGEDVLAVESGE